MKKPLLLLPLLFACAQDVGDVDRTQPYRLKKTLFEGEWYLQKTTFDVPYTAGFTFTGETSELERVRWEIQENQLIAFRTYDRVTNTQEPTQLPGTEFKGAPIAAYAIESHFDVVREYNALTGEETNVISENTMDRPWYERDFIRVNWSRNLAASFAFLDDQVAQSPMDYFVQDRADADRLLVGVRDGDTWTDYQDWEQIATLERADYLDVVDQLFAAPEEVIYEDEYGDVYAEPACWFYGVSDCQPARIKVRSAFLKVPEHSGYEALAYPDNEVIRNEDGTPKRDADGNVVRVPWFDKFGYFRVERDYYDRDRERTETGRTFLINRWSIWKDAPACKQGDSYANCEVKPIEYHLSPGFPASLKPAAQAVVGEWNQSFKQVVNHLKYGGQRPLEQVEDVFVLRDNTFQVGGDRGQRIGDLRHSFLYWIPEPQSVGPLGYGPSAADPLTGEIISASAYVYGAGLESWGAYGADVVQLLNGAIPPDDFIEGENIREYVARRRGNYAADATAVAAEGHARAEEGRSLVRSPAFQKARATQKRLGKRGMRLDGGKLRAKLQAIRNTPYEDQLLNDEVVRGLVPRTRGKGEQLLATLTPAEKARISPARWGTHGARRALEEKRRLKLRLHNLELAREFADDGVVGLAESLKGQDWQSVRNQIVEAVFRSTASHEVGHTLGLRHNFAGSFDPLNYPQQYWQLRGNQPTPFTDESEQQALGRMREYQYASIMDYGARFNTDIHGIGHYDRAAILFGYGQLVETFTRPPNEPLTEIFTLDTALHELRHYSSYPRLFGRDFRNMYERQVVPYRQLIDQLLTPAATPLVEVPYRFCSDEYEGAVPSCNTWDEGADAWEVTKNANRAYEDYYVFNSFGRDQREIDPWSHVDRVYGRYFSFGQLQYQNYVFRAFDYEGLWEELRADANYWDVQDLPFDEAVDGNLAGAVASREAMNQLARVIQAPEPGAYYVDPTDNGFYNYAYDQDLPLCPPGQSADDCSDLNVALGDGKYAFSLYKDDTGYYFYERVHVIGSFYDKLAALQTLTSPETYFLGVDADANLTQFAISMYLFFPDEVTRLVGGTSVEGYDHYAGVVENQAYVPRDMFAPPATYAGKPFVDPATSFTVELYATWLGMAFLNANFDNSFNDGMRIFEEGNGEGFVPAVAPERIVRYVHPRTGRTFVAVRAEDPDRYSPAFDLLTRIKTYQETITDPALRDYYVESWIALADNLRGLYQLYGRLQF